MSGGDPLSPQARALLDGLKRARTPTHDGAAVLASVRGEIAAGTGGASSAITTAGVILRIVAVVALVGGVGVMVWSAGDSRSVGERAPSAALPQGDAPPPSRAAPKLDGEPAAGFSAPRRPVLVSELGGARALGFAHEPDPVIAEPSTAPPRPSTKKRRHDAKPTARATRTVTSVPADRSALQGELKLLEEARIHLASGDLRASSAQLDDHARLFPKGQLRVEREAVRVLLACAQGRPDASEAAADFVRVHPTSPFGSRIESKCALTKTEAPGQGQE